MRKPEAHALTTEQRLLRWGPWWAAGATGTLLGTAAIIWGLARAQAREADPLGFWLLGVLLLVGGWAGAGLIRRYRQQHQDGLEGRNAPAQLWLLGHERLARIVMESFGYQGWAVCHNSPTTRKHDYTLLHEGKRLRLRCLRQPGAASMWAVDTHWQDTLRAGLDGLVLVNLGHFSAGAEDYARQRAIHLVQGPELMALICTHPDWMAMAEVKARWRMGTLEGTELEMMEPNAQRQDVCSLALVGLILGTRPPRDKQDIEQLDGLAKGLGWSDLEVCVRTLRLALTQACHDPRGISMEWIHYLVRARKDLLGTALWDVQWLVEWLEEQPHDAIWKALAPHWNTLAEQLPHPRDHHTRAELEAPLLVLWKLWRVGERSLPTTRARQEVLDRAERLGPFRIYPTANVLVDELERIHHRRRLSTRRERS